MGIAFAAVAVATALTSCAGRHDVLRVMSVWTGKPLAGARVVPLDPSHIGEEYITDSHGVVGPFLDAEPERMMVISARGYVAVTNRNHGVVRLRPELIGCP